MRTKESAVRQGCILSPSLFNVYADNMRDALPGFEGTVHFGSKRITDLRNANDRVPHLPAAVDKS